MGSPGHIALALSDEYALAIEQKAFARARRALLEELGARTGHRGRARWRPIRSAVRRSADLCRAGAGSGAGCPQQQRRRHGPRQPGPVPARAGGTWPEGKRQFEAGLATYEKQGDKPELLAVLREYGQALEHAGDYKGAVDASQRERALSSEIFADQRQKALMELQQKYEAETNQRRIDALRQQNRAAQAELENRRLQQRVWWLLAVTFALAALVVGLLYRKVRRANAELEERNQRLKRQSALDPLTALYNRRHFQEFMDGTDNERRAAGDDTVGAIFLLDVDHFKSVNDTLGHAAGDAVLKMVADNLRIALRDTDMIVRWGGEEFLAFLPAVARDGLDEVALRIMRGIPAQPLEYQGVRVPVTVSVGFAPFPLAFGTTPLTWERVVNIADMALYQAKSHGRNCACGVLDFPGAGQTTLDMIERDLQQAARRGWATLVSCRATPPSPPCRCARAADGSVFRHLVFERRDLREPARDDVQLVRREPGRQARVQVGAARRAPGGSRPRPIRDGGRRHLQSLCDVADGGRFAARREQEQQARLRRADAVPRLRARLDPALQHFLGAVQQEDEAGRFFCRRHRGASLTVAQCASSQSATCGHSRCSPWRRKKPMWPMAGRPAARAAIWRCSTGALTSGCTRMPMARGLATDRRRSRARAAAPARAPCARAPPCPGRRRNSRAASSSGSIAASRCAASLRRDRCGDPACNRAPGTGRVPAGASRTTPGPARRRRGSWP
ncbi:hypothetical protein Lal_00014764 [Lupinus albus]|nr:hypothetical protein Lal_00014764 [Lupinus albus]